MRLYLLLTLCSVLLVGCVGIPHKPVEQVQAPGVYPTCSYIASYRYTQTSPNPRELICPVKELLMFSSDGKGHIIRTASGMVYILDLPNGKCYEKQKNGTPAYYGRNSVTSYSNVSAENEIMFTHDTDVFDDPFHRTPAPQPIGSQLIDNYDCEGWRLTTYYKVVEWWFDKQTKCLVLMESKPNEDVLAKMQKGFEDATLTLIFGGVPAQQTMTERLIKLSKEPMPATWFDFTGLGPVKLVVWKAIQ